LIWFLSDSQVHRLVVNRDPKFTNFVEVIGFLVSVNSKFFIGYFATSESEHEGLCGFIYCEFVIEMVMKVVASCSWSHGRWIQWERRDTCFVCNCIGDLNDNHFLLWVCESIRLSEMLIEN
jgi:hypothetical protein